jgi:hypothetical protein
MHKVGWVHDFLTKFSVGMQSFKTVVLVGDMPESLLLTPCELSLVWAICFDANEIVFAWLDHCKKIYRIYL